MGHQHYAVQAVIDLVAERDLYASKLSEQSDIIGELVADASEEKFLVLCIPRDLCEPRAYGPFNNRSDAMIYMNKTCENKHNIVVLRSPE